MKKPTLNQVIAYFCQLGSTPQLATDFFNRYENNGWTITRLPTAESNWQPTRKPMKQWKNSASGFIRYNQQITKNRTYRRLT